MTNPPLTTCPRCTGKLMLSRGDLWCIACGDITDRRPADGLIEREAKETGGRRRDPSIQGMRL